MTTSGLRTAVPRHIVSLLLKYCEFFSLLLGKCIEEFEEDM
jgi:hypothetical protein